MRPGSALSRLVQEGQALLSALPSTESDDIVDVLLTSESPLATALRQRIAWTSSGQQSTLTRPVSPVSQIVREATILLSSLPEQVAKSIALAVSEGDSALAAELRQRAIQSASAVSKQQEQNLGSPGLTFLLQEGEKLISNLTEESSVSVVTAVLEGESEVARALRSRIFGSHATSGFPRPPSTETTAPGEIKQSAAPTPRTADFETEQDEMPQLISDARKLLRQLPDHLALEVVQAVAEEGSVLAAALRQTILQDGKASGENDIAALIQSSQELITHLPDEAAILLVTAVLEGESELASSLRLQLQSRPRSSLPSEAGSRPSSAASDTQNRNPTGLQQLLDEGKKLLFNLPEHLASSVLDSALNGHSALSAALRANQAVPDFQVAMEGPGPRERESAGRVWSLKHNRCTRLGLEPTLGVVRDGKPDVKGVLLDVFGQVPADADAGREAVVRLDEDQATQLTLRMEASGKVFKVLPYTWERLDDCEGVAELDQLTLAGAEERRVRVSTAQGEIRAGEWEYFEFQVEEGWNAVEVACEGSGGCLLMQRGARPDDASHDPESETKLLRLREEWRAKERLVERSHKAGDDQAAFTHLRAATNLFKQIEAATATRKKCFRQSFPPHGSLFHMTMVSNPSARPAERPAQTVQRPFLLAGELFPGHWHIGLKCTSDPRRPMRFRLSVRYTTATHLQSERAIRVTHLEGHDAAGEERRQADEARAKIQQADVRTLEKLKWERWNKVELARALGVKFTGTFYPPKLETAAVEAQRIVRGFLARRRKRWLGKVKERRAALRAKEAAVAAALPLEDKLLLRDFKSKFIPQELDDLRCATGAALSLRFGQLKTAYQLRTASRAVFNVVDEGGRGVIEGAGLSRALAMLGLDELDPETIAFVLEAFDADGSGAIDRAEFSGMILALCSSRGPGGIKAAVAAVTDPKRNRDPVKIAIAAPPPAKAEGSGTGPGGRANKLERDPAEMTASQLDNVLQRLKMRLTNRGEEDQTRAAEAEARRRAEAGAREEAERVRREAEERHAAEVEKRAAAEREEAMAAAEVEATALRVVGMSFRQMLAGQPHRTEGDVDGLAPALFARVNVGGDGRVSYEELKEAIRDTDLEVQDTHLQMAMDLFDHERCHGLSLPSFTKMLHALLPSPNPGDDSGREGTRRLWQKLQVFTRAIPSVLMLRAASQGTQLEVESSSRRLLPLQL